MLNIHFLNVGKGNCTIIDFPSGNLSMIDIDNSRTNGGLTNPIDYFKTKFNDRSIFRFILTHPDMDHMSGLDELTGTTSISNFWDTEHDKTFADEEWDASPYRQEDWEQYLKLRESQNNPKCLKNYRYESSNCCWTKDGITVLSPSANLVRLSGDVSENDPQKYNHLSYVLKVEYAGIKAILGGDASIEVWKDILDKCGEESLKADIFLAPHHGSENNIHEDAFDAIAPDYIIVSVNEGVDYAYQYYNRLAKKKVLSTKHYGNIRFDIKDNGEYLPIIVERNAEQ